MEYPIDRLDELISNDLQRIARSDFSLKKKEKQVFQEAFNRETTAVRASLWQFLQVAQDEKHVRIIVQQYLFSLEHLHSVVECYTENEMENGKQELYKYLTAEIDNLLKFSESHFGQWLEIPVSASPFYLHTSLNEPEICAVFCSLIDAGVIVNHSYKSLFGHLAPMLATRLKKGLRASSLLKSKDKLNADMKRRLKDLFMEMSRKVDGY